MASTTARGGALKRCFDAVIATAGLAVLAVPMAAVAVAIKIDSPGPVFYRGERVGLDGVTFRIFKFRSMRVTHGGGPMSTSDDDDRITRVGQYIRRYKLDELSQLINVVMGEMSVVGPRPEIKAFVDMYTEQEKLILTARPGITDWASIRFHNEGAIIKQSGYSDPEQAYLELVRPEKLRLQLKYVREQTFFTDLKIIGETLLVLVRSRAFAAERRAEATHSEVAVSAGIGVSADGGRSAGRSLGNADVS
jgi:lipopolysaccharide/colanic/teichoic acid biosynthesis glycosyltransferase